MSSKVKITIPINPIATASKPPKPWYSGYFHDVQPGDVTAGMKIAVAKNNDPIHNSGGKNTHAGPGVYDILEDEAVAKHGSMENAAKELMKKGMIVAVRRIGQSNIKSNHIHFADPQLADPKEVNRLASQSVGIYDGRSKSMAKRTKSSTG
jgi:hypothetical protein